MPSWNDGESSSPSQLGDFTDLDFAPDYVEDATFHGIAVNSPVLCRKHKLEPLQVVAFEGSNTGRRFYLCQVQHEVNNGGFVAWKDEELPTYLQNAVCKLWGMYHDLNVVRTDEKAENRMLLEQLAEEKNKVEKKYNSLLADVHKFMDCTEKNVMKDNLAKMEHTEKKLMDEVSMLKHVQVSQAEVMKAKQKTWEKEREEMNKTWEDEREAMKKAWEDEREAMKQETKKLEYMLFDMLKAKEKVREKLKRIKSICDE